jgi:O-antigen/teichoic acid export membrane protein
MLDATEIEREPPLPSAASKPAFEYALVRDSLSYFGSKVMPGFMGLISVPVFIRLIGLDQYGRLAVAVPLLMAIAGATSGWLAQGVLRFHPVTADPPGRVLSFERAVKRCTFASLLITLSGLAAVSAGLRYSIFSLLISLAFCGSLLVYTVMLSKLQAQLQPVSVLHREAIRSIGGFVFPLLIIAITGRRQFELILLGQAIAYTVALLPSSGWREQNATTNFQQTHADSTAEIVRELWRFGWAVGMWLLLSQVLPLIDRWTIQRFAGYASAGIYSSLYEIAIRSFSFLVFPLTQSAHPRIMRAWNEGHRAESYQMIRHSVLLQSAIFLVVIGGVSVTAPQITRLILGFDDPTAARLLPLLVIGGFLWQIALLLHKPLEISQRTIAMLIAMAAVVVLNVCACFLFIPRYGNLAAGYIVIFSACSYIVSTLFLSNFRAFRGYSPLTETS